MRRCRRSARSLRCRIVAVVGLASALLVAIGCGRAPSVNLLIISIDTTRADHLGAYGYEAAQTPTLDALAARGFLFRRHLTPVPITLPSHTTLMTGLYPPTHTVRDNVAFKVPQEAVTLAEVLRDEGYDTSAFVGSYPLAAEFGLDQGFDHYDDELERPGSRAAKGRFEIYFDERSAGDVVDAVAAYHQDRDPLRPFFAFVHFFDPHQPQIPPAPYDMTFRQLPYDGELAYVDEQIGRLLAFLEERGDLENTVVIVTADHGEGLGEHGELTHAMLLHQATLHIPLIVAGPGIPAGETWAWTSSTQVFRTALDLVGVAPPALEHAPGHSLLPLIENDGVAPADYPHFTSYFETMAPRISQGWSQLTAWMEDDWRLVHGPSPELFDVDVDPRELDDRFDDEPQVARGLLHGLRAFLAEHETTSVGEAAQEVDRETAERLAALGYLLGGIDDLSGLSDILDVEGLLDPKLRVADISLFSEAKGALARKDYDLARSLHEELLRRSPTNGWAFAGMGQVVGQSGDLEAALEYFDKAVEHNPENLQFQGQRAALMIDLGRYQEGIDALLEMPEPASRVDSCTWLGVAFRALGDDGEAESWYRKGLELDPQNSWLRLYLANLLASRGRFEDAEPFYRAIIADDPYFSLAYYNFGKMLTDQGDDEAAIGVLRRAAVLVPGHEMTRLALSRLEAGRSFSGDAQAEEVEGAEEAERGAEVGIGIAEMATFRGGIILADDLDRYLLALSTGQRRPASGEELGAWIRHQLEDLVERRLLTSDRRMALLADEPDFRLAWERRRVVALAEAHVNQIGHQISVSQEEARAYFDQYRESAKQPERRAVLNLLLAFGAEADEETKDEICSQAEELRREIERGASFETMAMRHSDSSTAASGGLIGAVRRSDLRGDAAELIFSLEPGQVSPVLRNAAGCQIFIVREVIPATEMTFESRYQEVHDTLFETSLRERVRIAADRVAADLGVEMPAALDLETLREQGPEEEVLTIAGEAITVGELMGSLRRGMAPEAALRQLADQRLLAVGLQLRAPDDAERLLARARDELAITLQRQRALAASLAALPSDVLRRFYDENRPRFITDPHAELVDLSWPIGPGDPQAALETPRAVVAALEEGEEVSAVWADFGQGSESRRKTLPLASVRQLVRGGLGIERVLRQSFGEGDVLGPIRVDDRLHVLYVDTFIPPRQLSFAEVQDRARALYGRKHASELEDARRAALFDEAELVIDESRLERFGAGLIDRLIQGEDR